MIQEGHDERDDYDDEPWRPRATPEQMLRNPAAILGAFGIIQLAISVLGCIGIVILMVWSLFVPDEPADANEVDDSILVMVVCLGCGLSVVTNFIIVRGAN